MALSVLRRTSTPLFKTILAKKPFQIATISDHERMMIGKREIVCYGSNGQPHYVDRWDMPFPAIRWKETDAELCALREKERGDWNELTCEEKKALYRSSFCQTFAEMNVSNLGEWKSVVATSLFLVVAGLWVFYYFKLTIYKAEPMPESFDEEHRRAMFRRMLDLRVNPVQGVSSRWDYEKDDWKNPRDSWKTTK